MKSCVNLLKNAKYFLKIYIFLHNCHSPPFMEFSSHLCQYGAVVVVTNYFIVIFLLSSTLSSHRHKIKVNIYTYKGSFSLSLYMLLSSHHQGIMWVTHYYYCIHALSFRFKQTVFACLFFERCRAIHAKMNAAFFCKTKPKLI